MPKSCYETLKAGLEDAVAFVDGDTSRGRIVVMEIPDPVPSYKATDVARTRKALNLSQRAFASAIGVSPKTVNAWEKGKTEPSGMASRFLYLLDNDHSLLERLTAR